MEQKPTTDANPVKQYSKEEISSILLSGYTLIHRELWEHIPTGSRVKYFVTDQAHSRRSEQAGTTITADKTPKEQRFRGGGTINKHIITEGDHILVISGNKPGPILYGQDNTYSYTISVKDIDELWKAYPKDAILELHIIMNRLCEAEHRIAMLEKQLSDDFAT